MVFDTISNTLDSDKLIDRNKDEDIGKQDSSQKNLRLGDSVTCRIIFRRTFWVNQVDQETKDVVILIAVIVIIVLRD